VSKPVPFAFRVLQSVERLIARFSVFGNPAIYNSGDFSWAKTLAESTPLIQAELAAIMQRREEIPNFQDVSSLQGNITQDDKWKTFIFYAYGAKSNWHCDQCPGTARALAAIPGMKTGMFSILAPGKVLPLHRGPYKGLLRAHLGLETTADAGIIVGGEKANWCNGAVLIFDDTFEHTAWNHASADRVVLFIDFERPLRQPLKMLNQVLLYVVPRTPFGRSAVNEFLRWYETRGIKIDVEL
jgi:ornithine lipid ester-linked acyl 2-hydroxylase